MAPVITGELIEVDLEGGSADVRASDLLLLRVSTSRPAWTPLAKAARLLVKLTLDNGDDRSRLVPLAQNGREHLIGLSYLEPTDPLFVAAFSPRSVIQSTERIAKIEVAWRPVDFLTPVPDLLILHRLETARREGSPVIERSVEAAWDASDSSAPR